MTPAPTDPAPAADMREPARIAIFDAVVGYDCRNVNTAHHRTDVALEAVRPLLAAAPTDPAPAADGWKLVPAEPTREMFMAGLAAIRTDNAEDNIDMPSLYPGTAAKCYRAMIAAAPPAPVWDGPGMLRQARQMVEDHIAVYGMVPHPDKMKDAIAVALTARSARVAELMTERARMDTQYADLLAINVAAEQRAEKAEKLFSSTSEKLTQSGLLREEAERERDWQRGLLHDEKVSRKIWVEAAAKAEARAARMAEALARTQRALLRAQHFMRNAGCDMDRDYPEVRAALRESGTLIETPAPEKPERA